MTEKKGEPPPRPRIRKRDDFPSPSASGGEVRRTTIEVQADWLEEDDPPAAPKPAPRPAPKSSPPKPGATRPAAAKPVPPLKRVPFPSSAKNKAVPRASSAKNKAVSRPSRSKITQPTIAYLPEPPELPPPPPQLARSRDRLAPPIPREERDSEPPPRPRPSEPPPRPRRRSKPPPR